LNALDKFSMKNKVSIVTGGARGLGKAMAIALAQAGSNIVIAEIDMEIAQKTSAEIKELYNVETIAVHCDVASPKEAQGMAKSAIDKFGKIDVLVNNAGITKNIPAESIPSEDWLEVINVNLNGVFFCAQAVGNYMIQQKSGQIINIASMAGVIVCTPQTQAAYNTSKAGVIHLTKSLACEWAQYNIRVNAIAPGYIRTDMTKDVFQKGGELPERWMSMTPMHHPGNPEDLDGIVLYLASEASAFTTGSIFLIDGGYTAW
jgi:NAD(P)-dependent dehydrogenase (short-subunit alcohol dehydrogenase family)